MKKNGPWTITDSEVKYKNPWIEVVEDRVIRPDGKPGIFGVITMQAGVSILPIDEENNVYLTKEFKYALQKDSIEVMSGGIDKGEAPQDAAERELLEESGISAEEWINLGSLNPFTSVVHSPAELFLARKLSFGKSDNEGTEQINLLKVKIEEAVQMVMESKITHGQSSVLILKAARYLGL